MIARKKQMHQLRFAKIAKNTCAIFLSERTELDIRLPAIAGFIMIIWWLASGGRGKSCSSDVESMNLEWKTAAPAPLGQQSLVDMSYWDLQRIYDL